MFTDSYYTSVELLPELEKNSTLSCGIVNPNSSRLPADMKRRSVEVRKLKGGKSLNITKGQILAVTCRDTHIISVSCDVPDYLANGIVSR